MGDESRIRDIVYQIDYQLPIFPTTWGTGVCGHNARSGRICLRCLTKMLVDEVGEEKAVAFIEARCLSQAAEFDLYY